MSQIIRNYFPHFSETKVQQLNQLNELYTFWNKNINVISRKDMDEFIIRHVLHSLSIVKLISFNQNAKVMDLGCGGGFPGIPLAIVFNDTEFILVDSVGKKIKVVNEIIKELKLKNVTAINGRAEDVSAKFDFVVSRAVAPLESLLKWTNKKFVRESNHTLNNGIICLKGGDLHEELSIAHNYLLQKKIQPNIQLYSISDWYSEDFFETKKIVYTQNSN